MFSLPAMGIIKSIYVYFSSAEEESRKQGGGDGVCWRCGQTAWRSACAPGASKRPLPSSNTHRVQRSNYRAAELNFHRRVARFKNSRVTIRSASLRHVMQHPYQKISHQIGQIYSVKMYECVSSSHMEVRFVNLWMSNAFRAPRKRLKSQQLNSQC